MNARVVKETDTVRQFSRYLIEWETKDGIYRCTERSTEEEAKIAFDTVVQLEGNTVERTVLY